MTFKKTARLFFAAVLILFNFFNSDNVFSETVTEEKQSSRKVRVGYYYCDFFQEGVSDDELKRGFSYGYLQKVGNYAGWEYQYVYGDWAHLIQDLEDGRIDLLAGVSYTEERNKSMLFPEHSMGTDNYWLYQPADSGKMTVSDLSSMDSKVIGGIRNNRMTYFLQKWVKENGIFLYIKMYDSFEDRDKDFYDGKLDGIVSPDNNITSDSGLSPVVKVGSEPFYLAVSKKNPELLAELNCALENINELEPYFLQDLQFSCFNKSLSNTKLSDYEESWLKDHNVLKVGYMNDFMPYCTNRQGKADGLVVDVFSAMLNQMNLNSCLTVEYFPYENYSSLLAAVKNNEIDAIFPAGGGDWHMEQDGINASSSVVSAGMNLVYKGTYSENITNRIAVNKKNQIQYYYAHSQYPEAEIIFCDSTVQCLNAVEHGNADSTIINGLRIDTILKNRSKDSLSFIQLEKADDSYIGVKSGNSSLLMLLNRGLKIIGRDYGVNASYNYVDELYSVSFSDFVHRHSFVVFICVLAVLTFIITLLVFIICRMKKEEKAREEYVRKLASAQKDTVEAKRDSMTDTLTGFGNRRAYERYFEASEGVALSDDFVVISMDLNDLKTVNDTTGHTAGDQLIKGAADCISETFLSYGEIFRTGGDEFFIFIEVPENEFKTVLKSFVQRMNSWHGSMVPELSISYGYASRRDYPSSSMKELQHIADKKMYECKSIYYSTHKNRRGNNKDVLINMLSSYVKVLKIDFKSDSFEVVKMAEDEKSSESGFSQSLSEWISNVCASKLIFDEDKTHFSLCTNKKYLETYFASSQKPFHLIYRRLINGEYRHVLMEIVLHSDETSGRSGSYLYVKEIEE